MKEKKKCKIKRLKRILPFICATLLLLGSCMTVCASSVDYSKVDVSKYSGQYPYYFFVYYESSDLIRVVFSEKPITFELKNNSVYCIRHIGGGVMADTTDNGASWKSENALSSNFGFTLSEASTIYSNYDIKNYNNEEEIFFQQPPKPIAEMAIPLTGAIQNQTKTILPIAVGCLALLIGSVILVKKLRIFV